MSDAKQLFVVVGPRGVVNVAYVIEKMDKWLSIVGEDAMLVVTDQGRGINPAVRAWAESAGVEVQEVQLNWRPDANGKATNMAAAYEFNDTCLTQADGLIAFVGEPGKDPAIKNAVETAGALGIKSFVVPPCPVQAVAVTL